MLTDGLFELINRSRDPLGEIMETITATDGVRLALYQYGDPSRPTIVFIHGYPDTHRVWDGVVDQLKNRYHIVTYDVRGFGASDTPSNESGFRIGQLVRDLQSVIDHVSPDRPVHLVAHDWGSMQVWSGLTPERLGPRIASFTSVSGPSIDYIGVWLRSKLLRRPWDVARQLAKSYYIFLAYIPVLAEALARYGVVDKVVQLSEGGGAKPSWRTRREAINGIYLYRQNVLPRLWKPRPPIVDVPTQVIAPNRDMHVLHTMQHQAPLGFASDLIAHYVEGNHWIVANQPAFIARLVSELIYEVTYYGEGA